MILLLDGYDEMAQYMNARERRSCLEALAELAKGGAKGILTSRPNYFTEGEELRLFDALYTSLEESYSLMGPEERGIVKAERVMLEQEITLDNLLRQQFIERYERSLQDLDEIQTKNLVARSLAHDLVGQEAVLRILEMAFRATEEGSTLSLSGKPVIISYLLEIVEELKISPDNATKNNLTEWQVYALIVDKLMWRDYRVVPEILPKDRQNFLQRLSMQLSSSQGGSIEETSFVELVRKVFQNQLRRVDPDSREQELQKLFENLRRSSTLTRSIISGKTGWRFSHNSLREYLASAYLIDALEKKEIKVQRIKISDAMKLFVSSLSEEKRILLLSTLGELHTMAASPGAVIGMYTTLMWDAGLRLVHTQPDPIGSLMVRIFGNPVVAREIELGRISFSYNNISTQLSSANFSGSSLTDIDFSGVNLKDANFSDSLLEGVSFRGSNLKGAKFQGTLLIEVDFTEANLSGANFRDLSDYTGIRTVTGTYDKEDALGYFAFAGAETNEVPAISRCKHHPNYPVAEKIARKLCAGSLCQLRGLINRGVSHENQHTAEEFIKQLEANGLVKVENKRSVLVGATVKGRGILKAFYQGDQLDKSLYKFFDISAKA